MPDDFTTRFKPAMDQSPDVLQQLSTALAPGGPAEAVEVASDDPHTHPQGGGVILTALRGANGM